MDVAIAMGTGEYYITMPEVVKVNLIPNNYDVLVMPNLYGDILSDLAAGLVGGLGVVPGANIGDKEAVFEPVHGSAPKHKGKFIANPPASILAGVMMLKYLGESKAVDRVEKAVVKVFEGGKYLTRDLGGNT